MKKQFNNTVEKESLDHPAVFTHLDWTEDDKCYRKTKMAPGGGLQQDKWKDHWSYIDQWYRMPNINDFLDKLGRSQHFSTLDLENGLHR